MLSTSVHQPGTEAAHPGIRYDDVNPGSCAPEAAELLRRAWSPPCLRYSDAYVKWQLTSPGAVPPRAMRASDGDRMVGFVALMPRQISTSDGPFVIYVRSFLAVHSDYRGARIATELLSRITEASDRPIFCFTQPGSRNERTSPQSATTRGWMFRRLTTLRTYMGGRTPPPDTSVVARKATVEEFLAMTKACKPGTTAWGLPTLEQAKHYLADPRGACFAIAQGRDGVPLGAALVVKSELLTTDGAEDVPSLDAVYLHDRHAEALGALRRFALEQVEGASIVSAPNLDALSAKDIRQAGFRATQSAFHLTILSDRTEPISREVVTSNLEVF